MDYVDGIIQSACGKGSIHDPGIRSLMWSIAKQNQEVLGQLIYRVPAVLGADMLIFEGGQTMTAIHSILSRNLRVR
jgi:hypothetical protein